MMKPVIEYTVDDEPQSTTEQDLTPNQILSNAGLDPAQYYLILVRNPHNQESYQDKGDETIHMHPNLRFISAFTGSTPVS
jgi:hypothetical protein